MFVFSIKERKCSGLSVMVDGSISSDNSAILFSLDVNFVSRPSVEMFRATSARYLVH